MKKTKSISIKRIKEEILRCLDEKGVSVKKIILFGSRARGDYSRFSDYDFLIITHKTYSVKEKMKIAGAIRKALAELYVSADIIINSEKEVEEKKNRIGCITRYAVREGIEV